METPGPRHDGLTDKQAADAREVKIEEPSGAPLEPTQTACTDFVPPTMGTWQRRLVMLSLCLTLFLSALDITILSTALPTIAQQLHLSAQQYAWIGSGFTLASTASTPVWAKMSDIFGRKPVIMTAAGAFMAGSLVCALSTTGDMLIGGRVVQGLGAGGSLVLVTIVIGDLFSMADRAKYYGITGIVFGVASAVGPVLGGVFSQTAGWQWCFYINLPFDGVALIVLFFALKVEINKEPIMKGLRSLDWTGFALIIGGTLCFLYGLESGSSGMASWSSAQVICLIVFGFLALVLFAVWEAKFAANPIIPFRIFDKATNIAAFTLACIHAFSFISYDFFLPLYFQVILGSTPLISGVTLFALIVPMSLMPVVGGLIIRKTGNYIITIYVGSALMTLGSGLFISFGTEREWAKIITFQMIAGIGAGLLFQSPMIALQNFLHQKDIAAAMSAYAFLRSLFTSISIVIGTVLIQRSLSTGSLTSLHGGGHSDADGTAEEDYMDGLHTMWAFYTAATGLMVISSVFIKQKGLSRKEGAGETSDSGQTQDTEKAQESKK